MSARVIIRLTWHVILVFTTFLAAGASPWTQSRINPSDLHALQGLHPYFCNSCLEQMNMNSSSPTWSLDVDPCGTDRNWFGVVCEEDPHDRQQLVVTSLALRGMGIQSQTADTPNPTLLLSRYFPPPIATLTSLTALDLSNNDLSGALPTWIANLTGLKQLLLSNNLITNVAPELADVTSLQILDLSYSELGVILPRGPAYFPNSLGQLSALKFLNLSQNGLQSPVPNAIAEMRKLIILDLSYNFFSGLLPSWIGDLKNLQVLEVQQNSFTGVPPAWLTAIRNVSLDHNMFCNGCCSSFPPYLIGIVAMCGLVAFLLLVVLATFLYCNCSRRAERNRNLEMAANATAGAGEWRVEGRVRELKEVPRRVGGGTPKVPVYMEGRLIAIASEERKGGKGKESLEGSSDEEWGNKGGRREGVVCTDL